jgi:hypothetical protein
MRKGFLLLTISCLILLSAYLCFGAASDATIRVTNHGGFGPASGDNFIWANQDPTTLFWGSFLIVTEDTYWCACNASLQYSFSTQVSLYIPDSDIHTGTLSLGPGYVSEAQICSTAIKAEATTCSLRIQQYVTGLWDGAFCDSMLTIQYVISNMSSSICTLKVGVFIDWDVPPTDYSNDAGAGVEKAQIIWIENVATPNFKFGNMRIPSDDIQATLHLRDNPSWPGSYFDDDLLRLWLDKPGLDLTDNEWPGDKSILVGAGGIILAPGEKHLEEYFIFGWDSNDVPLNARVWKTWLRNAGYYRGDVNTDNRGFERDIHNNILELAPKGGAINITDVVFLANFVLKETASPWPFTDQGDVDFDNEVTLTDVIALANFVFKKANVPIDRNRFLNLDYQTLFARPSIWANPDWK